MLRFRRFSSTFNQAKVLRKYPVGAVFHGYEIKRILTVPEFKLTAVDLAHLQTGSQHIHIDRDDKNNVFSVVFKTNPPDATGVPHILEHTTLCGSQKYPVRDPFFKMLNRSLATFMNAMTGHDYTFYPFATCNKADFNNLREVYLDATFNPLLKQEDFWQEGWRLENADITDKASDLVFKGVVYNEMKGQVSNSDYYFWTKFQESIYPALNNSGGDPQFITNLHYVDLVDYHSRNYHPSNAKTFTYGNFPLDETLKKLNQEFQAYGRRPISTRELKPIDLGDKVTRVDLRGQMDPNLPENRQIKTSLTWICGNPRNTYETFLLKILGNLLMDGHSSPLYQQLIESGLGYDFSVNSGVESTTNANFFTVGIQGCEKDTDLDEIVKSIFVTSLSKPFEEKKIEGILQQLELAKKDQKSDFGLQLLYSIVPNWVNKCDPFDSLLFDDILNQFRSDWAERRDEVFRDLIRNYLLNKGRFKFTVLGDNGFSESIKEEELQRLATKKEALNQADRDLIWKRGKELDNKQRMSEDLSCLPSLKISDIPRKGDGFSVTQTDNILKRLSNTNGITYVRGKRPLNTVIPQDLYPYLALFADSLTSLGTTHEEFSDIEDEIRLHTGGISANVSVVSDPETCEPSLQLDVGGWSLNHKTEHVFDLWNKILVQTDFNKHKEKLKVLIRSLAASNTASVAESGHSYARNYAGAHLRASKSVYESMGGLEQIQLITQIASLIDDDKLFQTAVIDKLAALQKCIVGSNGFQFFITADSSNQLDVVQGQIQKFLGNLPLVNDFQSFNVKEYPLVISQTPSTLIQFPFQVYYAAQSFVGVPYTHKDGAALQVLASVLTFKRLHREIREKGGAYGGGATYSALDGLFSFHSYRDPHPLNSLEVFSQTGDFVANSAKWTESDLDEAKLTIFQQVDAPISCKSEGSLLFHYGVSDTLRQRRREQLLDVQLDDVYRVADKYLLGRPAISAVIGPLIKEPALGSNWSIKNL
ncbi:LAMI_0D11848g1_1 [Lachancea mirantina]|uniref:Presequence protease, mitochondrial n=1 Tax=Lachancea mirantina TaxID=1230905 RepID=A0A1G4JFM8_9SACH|nr:LAMI_0D11848g1_1 [Lachancea mirantina]